MEQKIEREWKSIVCPDGKEKSVVMCEWDIISEKGRILKRTLKQIDCHSRRLTELGKRDCSWECEKIIGKGATKSGLEWLWVCAIFLGGILWIAFYDIYVKPHLHGYGVFLFLGLPLLIGLMLYYTWKMMRYISKAQI